MRLLEDILEANHRALGGAARGDVIPADVAGSLPIIALTCIDPRLNALLPGGLGIPSEQFIWLRNAGNIITGPLSSTMRSLALACAVKGGREIVILGHTDCQVCRTSMLELLERFQALGVDRSHLPENLTEYFGLFASERQNVMKAVETVRSSSLIGPEIPVHGLMVDIETGRLEWVVNGYQALEMAKSGQGTLARRSAVDALDGLKQMLPFHLGAMKFPEGKIGEVAAQAEGVTHRVEVAATRAEHLVDQAGAFVEKVGHLAGQATDWLKEVQAAPLKPTVPTAKPTGLKPSGTKLAETKRTPFKPVLVPPPIPPSQGGKK